MIEIDSSRFSTTLQPRVGNSGRKHFIGENDDFVPALPRVWMRTLISAWATVPVLIHDQGRLRMWVMITVRVVSLALVALMVVVIAVGFVSGDFSKEGSEILGLTWGRVTLIDLYVGLALFGIWVAFRERSWPRTLLWTAALVILGNLAAAVYVARAAFRSADVTTLLLGHQAS